MDLFIDFDGVICDSVRECYASALLARHGRLPREGDFAGAMYQAFLAFRPFVTDGEDYAVILELFAEGRAAPGPGVLAEAKRLWGGEKVAELRASFLRARSRFLAEEPERWYALNPLYPFLRSILPIALAKDDVFILSTKSAEYIHEILRRAGFPARESRVISVYGQTKLEAALGVLESRSVPNGFLVDDQIEHLLPCVGTQVFPFLAEWGYCSPGPWPVDSLSPAFFATLIFEH